MEIIQCKMRDLLFCTNAFVVLRGEKLNVRAAMDVRRIGRAMQPKLDDFNEVRDELVKKYQKVDDEGNPIENDKMIPLSDPDAFQAEFDELLDADVDLGVRPLLLSRLDTVKLTTEDVEALMFMIKDDVDEPIPN